MEKLIIYLKLIPVAIGNVFLLGILIPSGIIISLILILLAIPVGFCRIYIAALEKSLLRNPEQAINLKILIFLGKIVKYLAIIASKLSDWFTMLTHLCKRISRILLDWALG